MSAQPLVLAALLALLIATTAGAGSKSLPTIAETATPTGLERVGTSAPLQYDRWQSPTGRIRCDYRNQVGVGCVQLDRGWGIFLRSFGRANYGYPYSQPGPGRTLYYGQTWRISTFRCLSQSIGMKCWSTLTGNGFFISRNSRTRTLVQ